MTLLRRLRTASARLRPGLFAAALLGAGLLAADAPAGPVAATAPAPAPTATSSAVAPAPHALTAEDVGAWLDGMVPAALDTAMTPGAVVVVVKDGQVLFEKGYGYADYQKRIPVDARKTLFRPGSVSKLFTWTAVMQLVQAGKIDLDADVNRYLDFRIPAFHGIPVTMRQLMTHRAGFSESARDLISFDRAPPPLDQALKSYIPPRIFTPDGGPGYSNYGASLAGYIVQRVSGERFEDYVARHIFAPLQMEHSTFEQPLPAKFVPDMSKGYMDWNHPGHGFEIVKETPPGGLSATADDMAHFMIAHLQLGRYGQTQILSPAVAQEMHTTAWKAFPDLNGNLLGFYQQNINGHRVIAHGGDTVYFHSDLSLFIDDGVGVFVSVNAPGKDALAHHLRDQLFEGFADRYFLSLTGSDQPPAIDVATARAHAKLIAGSWIDTRRSDSTVIRLATLLQPTQVAATPDGRLEISMIGRKATFYEIAPFLWHEFNGHGRLQAIVDHGKVVRWGTDQIAPIEIFVRPSGLAAAGLEMPLTEAALAILLLTALIWPIGVLARVRYRGSFPYAGARGWAYRAVRLAAVVALAAMVLWLMVFQTIFATNGAPVEGMLHIAQVLALLAFAGGFLASIWNLVCAFRDRGWGGRIFAVVLVAAFGFMLNIALAYHLIGFGSNY